VAGAALVLTYNRTPPPAELRERCLRFGATAVEFVACDVSSLEGCEGLVKKVCLSFCLGICLFAPGVILGGSSE
jgi:hypothetical protein